MAQHLLTAGPLDARGLEGFLCEGQLLARKGTFRSGPLELGGQLAQFHAKALVGSDGPLTLGRGRLHGGGQRGDRVHHGVHVGTCPLDLLLGGLNRLLGPGIGLGGVLGGGGGIAATQGRLLDRLATFLEGQPFGFATALQLLPLGLELISAALQHGGLLTVERDLLLPAVDVEFLVVRHVPQPARHGVCLGLGNAQCGERGLNLRQTGGRRRFLLAHVGQSKTRGLDGLRERAVAPGKQHLFPAPHFIAQAGVAPGARRLPLEGALLLLHLIDDVVEACQVLLGRLELELG